MDISSQNFDAGALGFVDDNDFSNLAMISDEALAKIKSQNNPSFVKNPKDFLSPIKGHLGLGVKGRGKFKANPKQQMWITAFRKRTQEVKNLQQKLKATLQEGNKAQKTALENKIQSMLNELKQLKATNEELIKKNSEDAIPQEVIREQEVIEKTEYDTPTPESETSEPIESVSETTEPTTKKMNWIIPALGIGIIAYFIFKK